MWIIYISLLSKQIRQEKLNPLVIICTKKLTKAFCIWFSHLTLNIVWYETSPLSFPDFYLVGNFHFIYSYGYDSDFKHCLHM